MAGAAQSWSSSLPPAVALVTGPSCLMPPAWLRSNVMASPAVEEPTVLSMFLRNVFR